jgi:hypothetical protein
VHPCRAGSSTLADWLLQDQDLYTLAVPRGEKRSPHSVTTTTTKKANMCVNMQGFDCYTSNQTQ